MALDPQPGNPDRSPALVVFDAMGVLYTTGDDVAALLIPYLRELGCSLLDTAIRDLYRDASLGRMTSAAFWTVCGVAGDDADFCARHHLTPGIDTLLADLRRRGIPLACLSNDVSEWSRLLRERFGLDRFIDTWVISGDIGVRKPDPAAYAALAEAMRVSPARMVFLDDKQVNVDAASDAGLDAIVFTGVAPAREALRARGLLP